MITELERTRFEARCQRPGFIDGYGFTHTADPRDFLPDEEGCSLEEIQRWREDCKALDRKEEAVERKAGAFSVYADDGSWAGSMTFTPYGIGSYCFYAPDWNDDAEEELEAAS